jgi:hypothetical protein
MPRTKKLKPTLEGDAENEKAKHEPKVILFNYTIKAVIPTGPFANIQPEISVCAETLEEAEKFVIPHIDKLFVKYFNAYLNGIPDAKIAVNQVNNTVTVSAKMGKYEEIKSEHQGHTSPPAHSIMKTEACIKAEQAINGCTSLAALSLVKSRIENSVKLTPEEKVVLAFTLNTKNDELFKQTNPA